MWIGSHVRPFNSIYGAAGFANQVTCFLYSWNIPADIFYCPTSINLANAVPPILVAAPASSTNTPLWILVGRAIFGRRLGGVWLLKRV
jgi:hypothetical protein